MKIIHRELFKLNISTGGLDMEFMVWSSEEKSDHFFKFMDKNYPNTEIEPVYDPLDRVIGYMAEVTIVPPSVKKEIEKRGFGMSEV